MNIHEYEDKKSSQRNTKWLFQEGAIYSLFGISISHVLPIKYHMTYLKSSQPPFEGSLLNLLAMTLKITVKMYNI